MPNGERTDIGDCYPAIIRVIFTLEEYAEIFGEEAAIEEYKKQYGEQ